MSEKTLFQKIIDREIPADIVYEDEFCAAFRDIQPQAPVHILIVPKKPIPRVGDAVAEAEGVRSTDKGFRLVINQGRDGGETVPHLHVHLLAGRPLEWPPG